MVLDDLVEAGKIRAYGCSTFPPEQLVEARAAAGSLGVAPFRTEQPPHSPLTREVERSLLPWCQKYEMGVPTAVFASTS